jgi:hypothetical protein
MSARSRRARPGTRAPRLDAFPTRIRHDVGVEEDDQVAPACSQPALRAPPAKLLPPGATTRAPRSAATCAVPSEEPSSTTITSSGRGSWTASASSTRGSVRAASRAGMTTLYSTRRRYPRERQQVPSESPAVTGSTAFGPTSSVSFEYLAEQSVDERAPEPTDSWMLTVCAAEPPR